MAETTALVKVNPQVDSTVIALHDQSLKLQLYAKALVITCDGVYKSATNDLSIIRGLKKAIEDRRKEYTQPINDHLKAVNEAFKNLTAPINDADSITTQKMLMFRAEQEKKRQEQEEINRLRIEAAQKEMELKGELTESVDLVEVTPEAPKSVRAEMGTAGLRDNWKWEVIDLTLVPDEYKMINPAVLTPAARSYKDKRTIPGIRIYNEPSLVNTR